MTANVYKKLKGIRKESLRDNIVALTDLSEIATRELAKEHKPLGLEENKEIAKMGGYVAKEDIEKNLGKEIITNKSIDKITSNNNDIY